MKSSSSPSASATPPHSPTTQAPHPHSQAQAQARTSTAKSTSTSTIATSTTINVIAAATWSLASPTKTLRLDLASHESTCSLEFVLDVDEDVEASLASSLSPSLSRESSASDEPTAFQDDIHARIVLGAWVEASQHVNQENVERVRTLYSAKAFDVLGPLAPLHAERLNPFERALVGSGSGSGSPTSKVTVEFWPCGEAGWCSNDLLVRVDNEPAVLVLGSPGAVVADRWQRVAQLSTSVAVLVPSSSAWRAKPRSKGKRRLQASPELNDLKKEFHVVATRQSVWPHELSTLVDLCQLSHVVQADASSLPLEYQMAIEELRRPKEPALGRVKRKRSSSPSASTASAKASKEVDEEEEDDEEEDDEKNKSQSEAGAKLKLVFASHGEADTLGQVMPKASLTCGALWARLTSQTTDVSGGPQASNPSSSSSSSSSSLTSFQQTREAALARHSVFSPPSLVDNAPNRQILPNSSTTLILGSSRAKAWFDAAGGEDALRIAPGLRFVSRKTGATIAQVTSFPKISVVSNLDQKVDQDAIKTARDLKRVSA